MITRAFFCSHCIETTCTDPSYSSISFLPWPPKFSSCFGMILDKWGAAPFLPLYCMIEVGWCVILHVACINNSKYLGKETLKKNLQYLVVTPSEKPETASDGANLFFH